MGSTSSGLEQAATEIRSSAAGIFFIVISSKKGTNRVLGAWAMIESCPSAGLSYLFAQSLLRTGHALLAEVLGAPTFLPNSDVWAG
jgi:hypothetical protein